MYVSFQGIAVSEAPCEVEDEITGCFTNTMHRTHGIVEGAGKAHYIQQGNYWFTDGARDGSYEPSWTPNSTLTWKIPIAWHRKISRFTDDYDAIDLDYEIRFERSSRPLLVGGRLDMYKQNRHIDQDGTFRMEKFGHWTSRSRWCQVILDGITLQLTHWPW